MALFRGRRGNAGPTTPTVAAGDSEIVEFEDSGGRTLSMSRGELRDRYLPDQLDSHWHDADGLARLTHAALAASLFDEALEISSRLLAIDRNPSRGAAVRIDVLRQCGSLQDARDVARQFEASFGQAGAVLYALARVEEDAQDFETMRNLVWQAVQADPNSASVLDWWIRIETDSGATTANDCLRRASEIEHAWLPLLRIARTSGAAREPAAAKPVYSEILNRGGHESYVLLNVIGDLGTAEQFDLIVDVVLPWYNPTRHTSLVGLALLQACLDAGRVRDADSVLVRLGTETDPSIRAEVNALAQRLDSVKNSQVVAPHSQRHVFSRDHATEIASMTDEPTRLDSIDRSLITPPAASVVSKPISASHTSQYGATVLPEPLAFRDDVGWFQLLESPDFLFSTKPKGPQILAVPLFSERTSDPVLAGLAVGVPRLINDVLHAKTSARSHSLFPLDDNGVVKLPNGTYLADELRRTLVKYLPLETLVINGEVAGSGDVRRIRLILADGESLQPAWSYTVSATPTTLSRAVDELLLAAEEELSDRKLIVPVSVPNWFVEPPVYLAAAYVQAEAAIIQLGAVAQRRLPPSAAERAMQLLEPVKKLALTHTSSSLPRLLYAAGCVATVSVTGTLPTALADQLARFVAAEPLPGQPLQMLKPLLAKYGLAAADHVKTAQLAAADLRFADWLTRVEEPAR